VVRQVRVSSTICEVSSINHEEYTIKRPYRATPGHLPTLLRYLENHHDESQPHCCVIRILTLLRWLALSQLSSCLIRDVLAFRTPLHRLTKSLHSCTTDLITPPATSSESGTIPASQDGLQNLIHELQHSHEPLLRLYGNDLSKSHHELARQNASPLVQLGTLSHRTIPYSSTATSVPARRISYFRSFQRRLHQPEGAEKVLRHRRTLAPNNSSFYTAPVGQKSHWLATGSVEPVVHTLRCCIPRISAVSTPA
jgi:hypothetical protein